MSSTRSPTGCLACKTKHKKCDETKPHCLRCQKSHIECPGYIYVQNPNKPNRKPRTVPGPRHASGRSRAATHEETPLANTAKANPQLQDRLLLDPDLVTPEASHNVPSSSLRTNAEDLPRANDRSNRGISSPSFTRPLQRSSTDFATSNRLAAKGANTNLIQAHPNTSAVTPMTPGQTSLLAALLSLGTPLDVDTPPQPARPTAKSNALLVPNCSTHEDEDPEGTVIVICRQPVPDRTTKSNALPFVLQHYFAWISRVAFDPLNMRGIARDFVYKHFEDVDQSRWIIALLANIGGSVGNVEPVERSHEAMLTALQSAVRRRLKIVKSRPRPSRAELAGALDSAVETMFMHFYTNSPSDVITLIREAMPIFRQLCPEPPEVPINLRSLLRDRLNCLWRYARLDITFSVVTDMPMLFRYEVPDLSSQPVNISSSPSPRDGIVQWLHGIPNEIVLLLARMKLIREDGLTPNRETIASLEQNICDCQLSDGSSSNRFLGIMRFVVQECWRQGALVYLYMALCGDPCNTPRVQVAFKRYLKLLNGTKPGRVPDHYLLPTLPLICPAALRGRDREVIRRRVLGIYTRDRTRVATDITICVTEDYWARADAEERPVVWSDVAVSRRQVLGQ